MKLRTKVGSADHARTIQQSSMSEGCLIANRNTFITAAAGRAKVAAYYTAAAAAMAAVPGEPKIETI